MAISRNASDYQAKPSVVQEAKNSEIDMSDVADAIEKGDVVVEDAGEGFAIIEGVVSKETKWGSKPVDARLYISTDEVPKAKINRLKIEE